MGTGPGRKVPLSCQLRTSERGVLYLAGVLAFIPSAVFCGAPLHDDTAKPVLAIFCKGLEGKHLSSVAPQPVMAAVVAVGGYSENGQISIVHHHGHVYSPGGSAGKTLALITRTVDTGHGGAWL